MTNSMNKPEIETLSYKPKNKESVVECHNTMTSRECINCEIYAKGRCHLYNPEQPKDNPGPLEKLIVDRIELDLENIAANLEMLKSATKEQNRAKCVLTLEIAHITGEGGMFDDLKEAFE